MTNGLLNPANGYFQIGLLEDLLTGSYLLTRRDQFFPFEQAYQIVFKAIDFTNPLERIDMPVPAVLKVC